jgi:23S rRNA pseudouridine1911/1915/1917 synthase
MADRLDRYLVSHGLAGSRREAGRLIAAGQVRINGRLSVKSDTVTERDRVELTPAPAEAPILADPDVPIEILYQDPAVLVVNKPGLIPCHPLRPGERGTVMNAVVTIFPQAATAGVEPREGGLVHRLDNGTSGALMVALRKDCHAELRAAIRSGSIKRRYQALVVGRLEQSLEIDLSISHDRRRTRRMIVGGIGRRTGTRTFREAFTRVEPVRTTGNFTLVDVYPETGVRHQIRVHLASSRFPIVGDELYGGFGVPGLAPGRFWLHLKQLAFESPAAGAVTVIAQLPSDLAALLQA